MRVPHSHPRAPERPWHRRRARKTILSGAALADPARYAITVCYIRDRATRVLRSTRARQNLPIDYVEIHERHSFDPRSGASSGASSAQRRIDIVHAHDYKTDFYAWLLAKAEAVTPISTSARLYGPLLARAACYYAADKWLVARLSHADCRLRRAGSTSSIALDAAPTASCAC